MEALSSSAVNVSWTPVTLPETDYIITIHYTLVGRTKRQSSSGENLFTFIIYTTLLLLQYRFSECLSWLILWCGGWTDDW